MQIGKFEVLGHTWERASSTIFKVRRLADNRIYAMKVVTIRGKEDMKYVDQAELEFMVASHLIIPISKKSTRLRRSKASFVSKVPAPCWNLSTACHLQTASSCHCIAWSEACIMPPEH